MNRSTTPLLHVEDLVFGYPGRPLFDGWSHRFAPGLTWVRGTNGSGKSTLLQLMAGALTPTAGHLVAHGVVAEADPRGYRQQVFWCGPDRVAFEHLTPGEYFDFLAGLYPGMRRDELPELLEALQLTPHLHKRLDQMSTGTGRKIAVAAALMMHTPVTLIDEPLAGVDRMSMPVVRQRLAALARQPGRAVVVTSHEDLGEAAEGAAVIDLDG